MQKNNRNLYLLGFMGSGKSFLGQQLAKELAWSFCDLDDEIETIENCSVSSIFENKGEDYFRKLERDCLYGTAEKINTVVALGGGTPCFFDNMNWIKTQGCSFFLDVETDVLVERLLKETHKRPLLKGKSEEELICFINQKLETRKCYYSQANYSLSGSDLSIRKIKSLIKNYL